ncbi:bacterial cytochrome ubiquinol oxidase, partial [Burkholderia multivorans ATCC BAA-247]
ALRRTTATGLPRRRAAWRSRAERAWETILSAFGAAACAQRRGTESSTAGARLHAQPVFRVHIFGDAASTVSMRARAIARIVRNALSSFTLRCRATWSSCARTCNRAVARFPVSGARPHNHEHITIMEIFDAFHLARLQFAFTVSFHIVFPAISIGMASFLAVLEWRYLVTGDAAYKSMFQFWSKIFAIGFGMGVVSGVVMAYEFGTNWSGFSRIAGNITGPLLTYEVLTAFFLEAGFLGVMLFGWQRVSPRAHFFATLMVAVGTLISTFWILASNSFMQTPQGYRIENGLVVPVDWFKVVFNPSFPYRLVHMTIAAFIVAGFIVAACGAWHLLKGRRDEPVKRSFSMALWMLLLLAPIQIVVGDAHGLNTREYQPAKIAAIEGLWETEKGGTALNLVGLPDMQAETTRYAIQVPHLGSLILTHSWDGEIRGLKEFAPQDRPYSPVVFWTFRIMAGLGMLMLLTALLGLLLRKGGRLYETRWFQWFVLGMGPSGIVALLAGWITTEVGRQPWTVYGVLRTVDSVSPLTAQQVGVSLLVFVVVYFLVFGTGIYYMMKLMKHGPAAQAGYIELHRHPGLRNRALSTSLDTAEAE